MRDGAAYKRGVQRPRQNEIGDIPSTPGEQPSILAARHRPPDELLRLELSHGKSPSRVVTVERIGPAAARGLPARRVRRQRKRPETVAEDRGRLASGEKQQM